MSMSMSMSKYPRSLLLCIIKKFFFLFFFSRHLSYIPLPLPHLYLSIVVCTVCMYVYPSRNAGSELFDMDMT